MSDISQNNNPPPVPPTPAPATPPSTPESGKSGLAPNVAAGLAMLFTLVGGLIFYFTEKKNAFVRFYALQGIYFGSVWLAFNVAVWVLMVMVSFLPLTIILLLARLLNLVSLGFAVVAIIAAVNAFQSKEWEIPWLGKIVRKHLAEGKFFFGKAPAA